MLRTFCTGVRLMLAEVSVTVLVLPSTACSVKRWACPLADGARPAFSVATSAVDVALTASTPSTDSTFAPRAMPAAAAGEPGSVKATLMLRGADRATKANCRP